MIVYYFTEISRGIFKLVRAIVKSEWEHPELVEGCSSNDDLRPTRTLRQAQGANRQFANQLCNSLVKIAWLIICLVIITGCALDMREQPRYESFEESAFFEDRLSARPPVPDTVARGQLRTDEHLYTGQVGNDFATTFPFTVTMEVLERGQERYNIFCTPCHGLVGDGQGIVVEYGMREPTSFHDPEVRAQPPGYYFDFISRGSRVMPSYASRIPPEDRWAIVAYIRALQLSQNADLSIVPPEEVPNLE